MTTNWHEYPSNFSNGTSVEGIGSWFQYTSTLLGDWLGIGIMILIFLASFIISLASGTRKALMVSGFISFIFSIYLARLDMIHPVFIITFIILTIIGAIGSKQEQGL